jgi:uncharacterized protein YggE
MQRKDKKMQHYKYWFITLIGALLIINLFLFIQIGLIPTPALAQTEPPTQDILARTMTVIGEGTANIEPDMAQATIGIQITHENLQEATSTAQQRMDAVLTALQNQGIAEQDIQTANFNIFVEQPRGPEGQPSGEILYHVNNDVQVIIRELNNIGPVLDAAIEAGANNIYGVNFSVADADAARAQAREEALNSATAQAQDLAQLANVQLGEVVRISEVMGDQGPIPFAVQAEGMGGAGGPITPGQLEVTVLLEVTYAME